MRLKSIKLAGFKSFVDPTTVPFPSNLAAVVGPNGCGKSNIIDAVRWVMGESSAKHLRGESMTDVIFNGSNGRKPVGQASIELLFDNGEGKLVGEYAQYNEISVKRKVTREAQSFYYLNGTKCRRRDITGLFLGTGLGPRSYAIIEQGMISKLIESKPEELRVFLEEAAGISKYKERRRETENRMRRTQENLERLSDIREELDRQLTHLQKQAQAAEKYTELKKDERLKSAQLNALKWRALDRQVVSRSGQISELELALEQALHARTSTEAASEQLRIEHQDKNDQFSHFQASYYESGAAIARVEQSLQHQKERSEQRQRELQEVEATMTDLQGELSSDQQRLEDATEEYETLTPELEEGLAQSEEAVERLASLEDEMQRWQQEWEHFNHRSSDARQRAEVEQARIQQSEQALLRYEEKRDKLLEELSLLKSQHDPQILEELNETIAEKELMVEEVLLAKHEAGGAISTLRDTIQLQEQALAELRRQYQQQSGALASKIALQDGALGNDDKERLAWLEKLGVDTGQSLTHQLSVSGNWNTAVEVVLGPFLKSVKVPSLGHIPAPQLSGIDATVTLFEDRVANKSEACLALSRNDRLSAFVEGGDVYNGILDKVWVANELSVAMAQRNQIGFDESIVLPDGTLVGKHWISMSKQNSIEGGLLQRQKDIDALQVEVLKVQREINGAEERLVASRQRLAESETALEAAARKVSEEEKGLSSHRSQLSSQKVRYEQIQTRVVRAREDLEDLELQKTEESEKLRQARVVWQQAMEEMEKNADERERQLQRRDDVRASLDAFRQRARHQRDLSHQLQLRAQAAKSLMDSLSATLYKLTVQLERIQERHRLLMENANSNADPVEELQVRLEGLLENRLKEERLLTGAREALESVDQQLREQEHFRSLNEQKINEIRGKLEKQRMEAQALEIHREGMAEQLKQSGFDLEVVLANLPTEAEESAWNEALERIAGRIQRLGAINLAAIDEYKIQSERKGYLDAQDEDLREALDTLESAIRKIDRETRARFKETYDKVNNGLQELFPKVFGGGSAYLDLTGDDLLETGVSIMARPPGKKNSTIHLLSGGEKALTAIALIFSIFQLNPAPFCMLDEVDAPLDDANVARYANMVREMSAQVQFIYITHNKIAMEMADQLMGVTMHEPGVSRLVSVDVEEAAALAAV